MKRFHAYVLGSLIAASCTTSTIDPQNLTSDQINEAQAFVSNALGETKITSPIIKQDDVLFAQILSQYYAHYPNHYLIASFYVDHVIYLENNTANKTLPLLVHELTHYWQDINHKTYPCRAAKERLAYTLQNKFAAQHEYTNMIVPEVKIEQYSACGLEK